MAHVSKIIVQSSNSLHTDAGGGHHNQSDPTSAKFTDYKLNTCEGDSFFSDTVRKDDVTKVMGKTLNMVKGFTNFYYCQR